MLHFAGGGPGGITFSVTPVPIPFSGFEAGAGPSPPPLGFVGSSTEGEGAPPLGFVGGSTKGDAIAAAKRANKIACRFMATESCSKELTE